MDKLIKAKKAAQAVLGISIFMLIVGILGSSLAIHFGQNASGYAVIALIPIGLLGAAYGAYMMKNIIACVNVVKGVEDGRASVDDLCSAKTDAARRNTEKTVKQCIEEGFLDGYVLNEDGEIAIAESEICEDAEAVCEEVAAESICDESDGAATEAEEQAAEPTEEDKE
ncbi:MAG: hypothetical protein HFH71_00885 [Clostridia bacterium]|nr:hypothetical protein [Clostridia bacterium]